MAALLLAACAAAAATDRRRLGAVQVGHSCSSPWFPKPFHALFVGACRCCRPGPYPNCGTQYARRQPRRVRFPAAAATPLPDRARQDHRQAA